MQNLKWWQTVVFYQIYPRSFADGKGDGIGDFVGMTEKLDYLKNLGIDALWLSPHYPSPQADCGYDVADYVDVDPEYGTLDDFKTFLEGAHQRGIRVILDLVLNHSSDQHPWFVESRSSRDNPKRDWYVWRDGKIGPDGEKLPPNNWESTFTGSAWEYDETTDQYYYHHFLKEQPDLNWRNPEVKAAMWDAVRFWLDLGVDGFRLDAIATIFEHPDMPDHDSELTLMGLYQAWEAVKTDADRTALEGMWETLFKYQFNQPGLHELMQELREVLDEYPDRVLVGEDDDIAYYGDTDNELHLVFNFPLMRAQRLTPAHIRKNQVARLSALPEGAWPCNTLGNHDTQRVWSHYGGGTPDGTPGPHERELAQLSLALMLTLRGTPFLYNGEEIGMTNRVVDDLSQLRDTLAIRQYEMAVAHGMPKEQASLMFRQYSRDNCRTPVQWANAPHAGFSPEGVETWLPVHPNYADGVNVADQVGDPDSMLNFYKRMLVMRKQTPAFITGDYVPLLDENEDCFCFLRSTQQQTCLVVLNFSENTHTLAFDLARRPARLVFSSASRKDAGNFSALEIAPFEVYISELA